MGSEIARRALRTPWRVRSDRGGIIHSTTARYCSRASAPVSECCAFDAQGARRRPIISAKRYNRVASNTLVGPKRSLLADVWGVATDHAHCEDSTNGTWRS